MSNNKLIKPYSVTKNKFKENKEFFILRYNIICDIDNTKCCLIVTKIRFLYVIKKYFIIIITSTQNKAINNFIVQCLLDAIIFLKELIVSDLKTAYKNQLFLLKKKKTVNAL